MPEQLQPTLAGAQLQLRPLRPDDFDALYAVADDPLLWQQHPESTRYQRPVFEAFFATALASGGALVVTDRERVCVIGSSRYYDWQPARREVAIGYTFLARSHWGGIANHELKQLMLDHAFGWADVVWFHVGKSNLRSRRAMEKLGAVLSHVEPRTPGTVLTEHVVYRIDAQAWAAR